MVYLFTTPTCVNCPRVKEVVLRDENLSKKVEILNALEHQDLCKEYNVRSVPCFVVDGVPHIASGMSEDEIRNLIMGAN